MSIHHPRPPVRAQSFPNENVFNQQFPTAPSFLEPSTQPYWAQAPAHPPPRIRMGSVSSAASSMSDETPTGHRPRRAARPKYDHEMSYFIWFHRTDLGMSWNDVRDAFNKYFHKTRDVPGIQSKYYRVLNDHGVPSIRQQRRGRETPRDSNNDAKMRDVVKGVHYAWMNDRIPR